MCEIERESSSRRGAATSTRRVRSRISVGALTLGCYPNWIRAHYDRFALLVAALFLFLCAFFIWRNTMRFSENFAALQLSPLPKKAVPLPNATALQDAGQALHQPAQWTFGGRSGLFVPEKHFIGPNGLPATLQNTEIHPPVPNEWLEQFGLPIAEADV